MSTSETTPARYDRSGMGAFVNLLDPDRMPRMTKRWRPQLANRQDKLLTPKELKRSVLHGERMQALIDEVSELQ